jgi:hypothetical protein
MQRADVNVGFIAVFDVHFLKMFPNIDSLPHTFIKIAKKRYGFYVRDTKILPEGEISNEIKYMLIFGALINAIKINSNIVVIVVSKHRRIFEMKQKQCFEL